MSKRTLNILIASAIGLMFVAAVLIVFLPNGGKRFGWDLQGYWVTADGTVRGQESFSISGSVKDQPDQLYDHVKMQYTFPSSQKFSFSSDTGVLSYARIAYGVSYYGGASLSFSSDKNAYIPSIYAIDLDKGYVLLNFDDGSGLYFVAASDPNVEPSDILEHFSAIIQDTKNY